jgi:hypothetical protein
MEVIDTGDRAAVEFEDYVPRFEAGLLRGARRLEAHDKTGFIP